MEKNYIKRDRYIVLMELLNKAIKNEYFYEAIFIEYAVVEDKIASMLKHLNIKYIDSKTGLPYTLNQKLNIIKKSSIFKNDGYIKKHITLSLIDSVYSWKDKRNPLIHNLANLSYENEDIKNLAIEGYDLVKVLNNKVNLVNKYADKVVV